jgi:hypothetical protein
VENLFAMKSLRLAWLGHCEIPLQPEAVSGMIPVPIKHLWISWTMEIRSDRFKRKSPASMRASTGILSQDIQINGGQTPPSVEEEGP